MAQLQVELLREPDIADRASSETDWSIELRTRDRQRKLIAKIDCAIRRLYEGEYGYCEVTGEPISLARLEARPIATMTLEAQEQPRADRARFARRLTYKCGLACGSCLALMPHDRHLCSPVAASARAEALIRVYKAN